MGFVQSSVVSRQSSATEGLSPPVLRGLTLVELLVVIVLISTLVSTAIPIISPGGEDRKLREASRNINAYFQGAQARAIETGRPFGVALRRLSEETGRGDDNAVVAQLEYVEVPAPYSGFDNSSLARVCVGTAQVGSPSQRGVRQLALQLVRHGTVQDTGNDGLPSGYDLDLVPDRFLRPGDRVLVGNSWYEFILPQIESLTIFSAGAMEFAPLRTAGAASGYFDTSDATKQYAFAIRPVAEPARTAAAGAGPLSLTPGTDLRVTHDWQGNELPPPEVLATRDTVRYACTAPAPFKIYRQPVPAGGESLELPNGIAIDLQASAFQNGERLYQPTLAPTYDDSTDTFGPITDPVMVLFSPEGSVARRYLTDLRGLNDSTVTSTLAMCVGRRELIPPERQASSLESPNNTPPAGVLTSVPLGYDEPINLAADLSGLTEDEQREITDKYNWLNLESRWVVIGAQSGAIRTVETSAAFPSDATRTFAGQLQAALEGVQSGTKAGGL